MTKALKACSPRGQRGPPPRPRLRCGGGGVSAVDLVAFGCGRLRPRGGDRRRSTARLLRAAEMRPKTSGSAPEGSGAGSKGCSTRRGAREAEEPSEAEEVGALMRRPGVVSGGGRGGGAGQHPPLPAALILHLQPSPGQRGSWAWGTSGIRGPRALGPGEGGSLTSWGTPCTGGLQGGRRLRGPGRRGVPDRAKRTALPHPRAGPAGRDLGGLVRPEAAPSCTTGPPQSHHAPRGRRGSNG